MSYVIVEVDQNYGLKFHETSQTGSSYWLEKIVQQAT